MYFIVGSILDDIKKALMCWYFCIIFWTSNP